MNQIYACRKGREIPFTGTTRINTTSPATRSDGRNLIVKLLMGVFVFLAFGATQSMGQTRTYIAGAGQTFIVPPGVTSLNIDVTGAGGGGAGTPTTATNGAAGGGGGGGSFGRYLAVPVTSGQTVTINVGAGGAGGLGVGPFAGQPGGNTTVSVGAIAHPGAGGGQLNTGGVGDNTNTTGGNGGNGAVVPPAAAPPWPGGGGGGGAATFATNGTNGALGTTVAGNAAGGATGGGAGGGGGQNGLPATAIGGGGGGASAGNLTHDGGIGGDGRVIITWTCPTYTITGVGGVGNFGPFCVTDGPQALTGTPAYQGISAPFGPSFTSSAAGAITGAAPTQSFNPAIALPGCHTITYSWTGPADGCTITTTISVIVFPATPTIPAIANTCDADPTITAIPVVAGFTDEYNVTSPTAVSSGYGTLAAANIFMTAARGCWLVQARYRATPACATAAGFNTVSGAAGCGAGSTNVVVFPTNPTLTGPPATCNAALAQPAGATAVTGFKVQWNIDGGGFNNTPFAGPSAVGCHTFQARYVLAADCGATLTDNAGPCANSAAVSGVVFPANPAQNNLAPVCFGTPWTVPVMPNINGTGGAVFVYQYNLDGGGFMFQPATQPTACGQYNNLQGRYTLTSGCAPTIAANAAGTPGPCANTVFQGAIVCGGTMADPADGNVCCNTVVSRTFVPSAGVPPGGTYDFPWTNTNPLIGLGAAGTSTGTLAFTAQCNATTQTGTITVTPRYTYTQAGPGGGTVSCLGTPQSYTITVFASVVGIIQLPANSTICAGQQGNVNVDLNGSVPANFTGVFNIFNNTTLANVPYTWNSTTLGGPQNIPITPGSTFLPNTTNTPITYTISWISLTDNTSGCTVTAPNANLQGQTNITVNPLPNLHITKSPTAAIVCPGTAVGFTVNSDPGLPNGNNPGGAPNTVPATFNYTLTATPANAQTIAAGYPFSGSTVAYGSTITAPGLACNYNGVITFTATPFATLAPNCPGPTESLNYTTQDITNPNLKAIPPAIVPTPGDKGSICNPPQATFQPSFANIASRYEDNCTIPIVAANVTLESATNTGNNCGWQWDYVFRITDACGNFILTPTITYFGDDITPPTFDQAAGFLNRTVNYCDNAALLAAQNAWMTIPTALTATDPNGCTAPGAIVITKFPGVFAVGTCTTRGTITNNYTATDACGNVSATYAQVITIVDNTGPVINGGVAIPNQTLDVGGPGCQATLPNYVTLLPIPVTDCVPAANPLFPPNPAITYNQAGGPNTVFQSPVPGITVFGPAGTIIPITITAQDACGNTSTRTFNVSLVDAVAPTAVCRALNNTTAGLSNSRVVLGTNGQFTITVQSNSAAVQNVNGGSSDNCGGVLTYSFTAMGFVGGMPTNVTPTRTYTCTDIPNGSQSAIVTTRMWVMDQYGNQSFCDAAVTVIDNTAPVFTNCPPNGSLSLIRDGGCTATVPNYIATIPINATDACNPVTYTQSPLAGSILGAGAPVPNNGQFIDIVITATDAHTNQTTCTFRVNLLDQTPPSFGGTCPGNMNAFAGAGSCNQTVGWTVPTATDNCAPANNQGPITYSVVATGNNTNPDLSAVGYRTPGNAVTAVFFVGTTTVTYTASDNAFPTANTQTCVFTVTVTDNTPPVITNCSAPLTTTKNVNTSTSACTYTHSGTTWDITATDNCLLAITPYAYSLSGATNTVGFVNANTLNGVVFNRGTTTVIWRVTDFSGNIATCTFQVIVTDAVPPVFNGPNVGGCVANQTVVANTAGCVWTYPAGSTILQVNATDNCGITLFEWDISGASPPASGNATVPFTGTTTNGTWGIPNLTVFQVGVTNVQYRIRDAQGNIVTCIFTVTVQNNVTGTIQVGTPPAANTTVSQNGATTSTVTFTGSGSGAAPGAQQYRFFYSFSNTGPGGPFVAQPAVTTGVGSNITTVAQSNAALGNFSYRLDQVQDMTTGCMSPANLNMIATITVVVGSDLTVQWTALGGLNFPAAGSTNDFTLSVVNIGATPSSGAIIIRIPRTSGFTLALNGVFNNADWTLTNPGAPFGFWVLTSNAAVIPPSPGPGNTSTIGIRATRAVGVAANTSQSQTATLQNGTGGDATPGNNTTSIQLTAQ